MTFSLGDAAPGLPRQGLQGGGQDSCWILLLQESYPVVLESCLLLAPGQTDLQRGVKAGLVTPHRSMRTPRLLQPHPLSPSLWG